MTLTLEKDLKQEEVEKLVIEIESLIEKRNGIENTLRDKLSKLEKLREYDELWVWCSYCGHRHKHYAIVGWKHKQYIKRIPKKCLFKTDHIFKTIEEKYGKRDEMGIPNITVKECIICGKRIERVYCWTTHTREEKQAIRFLEFFFEIFYLL
jgi:hypothetical protein